MISHYLKQKSQVHKKLFLLVNFETMYQIQFILDYSLFLLNDLVLLYHLILQMHLHVFPSSLSVYWNTKLSLARTWPGGMADLYTKRRLLLPVAVGVRVGLGGAGVAVFFTSLIDWIFAWTLVGTIEDTFSAIFDATDLTGVAVVLTAAAGLGLDFFLWCFLLFLKIFFIFFFFLASTLSINASKTTSKINKCISLIFILTDRRVRWTCPYMKQLHLKQNCLSSIFSNKLTSGIYNLHLINFLYFVL